jgi:putative sterol carrier protein
MGTFSSPQEVYDTVGAFLAELALDSEVRPKFVSANTSFHVIYSDPECEMVMDCTTDPPTVTCGEPRESEITLVMSADDGHRFWLGELNMAIALAKGRVKVRGPVSKVMKLLPAMRPAFPKYRAFLARGRQPMSANP